MHSIQFKRPDAQRHSYSMLKNSLLVILLLSLSLAACASDEDKPAPKPADMSASAPRSREIQLEKPMPSFSKISLSGDSLRSQSLRGKVTLVNFWATWCGPCVIETPDFVALRNEWKDRNFEIVGISMDTEGFEVVSGFAEDFQIPYPLILDEGPLSDEFGGVYALPTTFVVDAEGLIRHRFIGAFPVEEMKETLDEMIRETEDA